MNTQYPMLNQDVDLNYKFFRNVDNQSYDNLCMVTNMKRHILSDLCLIQNEHSLPLIKECLHSNRERSVS